MNGKALILAVHYDPRRWIARVEEAFFMCEERAGGRFSFTEFKAAKG